MAKINICDICKSKGKLTEVRTYMKVRSRKDLKLDYCQDCKSTIPKSMTEYVKFVYSLKGVGLSDEEAKEMLVRQ